MSILNQAGGQFPADQTASASDNNSQYLYSFGGNLIISPSDALVFTFDLGSIGFTGVRHKGWVFIYLNIPIKFR